MPAAKWRCTHPGCGVNAKNEAGFTEHWETFHFEEDYPGPPKVMKARKASDKGSGTKAATPRLVASQNDANRTPGISRSSRAKGGAQAVEMTEPKEEVIEGENGSDELDLDDIPSAADEPDEEMTTSSSPASNSKTTAKRKATGTPRNSAPPTKKPAIARPSIPTCPSTPKTILSRLQGTDTATPRTPPARRRAEFVDDDGEDTPDIARRTLGARTIARLTEKASNDPSRELQPIRRPLPPRFQEWNSDEDSDIGANDSSDDEASVPPPAPRIGLPNPQRYDPFYNQDLSDSDASTGISETSSGTPRAWSPSTPGPDPVHPYSTSAKYRLMPPRGIVQNRDGTVIDFDACMTFPDVPNADILNRNKKAATKKMENVSESVLPQRKVVMMSFSDNIATPEINWAVRSKSQASPQTDRDATNIGEPLSPPLHPSALNLSTTGDAIMLAYIEASNRAKAKAKEKQGAKSRGGGRDGGAVKKKKRASRLPKYEKRKYTWKDSTRKNKGRLYDSRRKEGEGEMGGGEGDG